MSKEIRELLSAHSQEGTLESEGSFTVDIERARSKSHRFGAENQDKALLCLLMAVLKYDPQSLDLRLSSKSLKIMARGAERLLDDVRTLGGELGSALWSCHYSGFSCIHCEIRGQSLKLDQAGVSELQDPQVDDHRTVSLELFYEQSSAGFWDGFRALIRGRGLSTVTLQRHLRYARIPIHLDSLALNAPTENGKGRLAFELFLTGTDGTESAEVSHLSQNRRNALHAYVKEQKLQEGSSWDTFCKIQRPADKRRFGLTRESWLTVKNPSVLAHLWLPIGTKGPSAITLVQHGVVVGTRPFPVPGVVSAHGLDTDLTGLEIVMNSKLEELEKYLHESVSRTCRALRRLPLPRSVATALTQHKL